MNEQNQNSKVENSEQSEKGIQKNSKVPMIVKVEKDDSDHENEILDFEPRSSRRMVPLAVETLNPTGTHNEAESAGQDGKATVQAYSVRSAHSFFMKHSYRDVGRKKCHFCLSFCSVFLVVVSTLIINTLVDIGPIIFLKLAEGTYGQYDAIIFP